MMAPLRGGRVPTPSEINSRAQKVLEHVLAHPRATTHDVALALGVDESIALRVLKALKELGFVRAHRGPTGKMSHYGFVATGARNLASPPEDA